ncbi:hypothetical protein WJX73_008941 [Symbiochloris irregularis]|uniref:Uncharacterized protein n=1 Tax=Symbiochloris irregularis TaxID=706552 RepID=A0AAW1PAP9_9CHLO
MVMAMTSDHPVTKLSFEGHPGRSLWVWLYTDVTNGGEIQQQITSASAPLDLAALNAALVPDVWILHLAAHKALTAASRGLQRAHTLHAQVVCNISGSRHIGEALKRYGVGKQCSSLLVAKFEPTPQQEKQVQELVKGKAVPLTELPGLCNRTLLQKYHKLSAPEAAQLVDSVTSHIAATDC